jgi:phosphoribosylglycinamide formyltransferase-1
MARLKIGILISGRGSNMQALIEAARAPGFPAEVALVVSNEPQAYGLTLAQAAGVPTRTVAHRAYERDRTGFERALTAELQSAAVDLVCLAGFMRLVGEEFIDQWWNRLVNVHPSLLPAFKGLRTHQRALASGVRLHGCTIHFVRPAMDDGPIIVQSAVPVLQDDTPERLAARVLEAEHICYPLAVRLIGERRVTVEGERVLIAGMPAQDAALIHPPPTA